MNKRHRKWRANWDAKKKRCPSCHKKRLPDHFVPYLGTKPWTIICKFCEGRSHKSRMGKTKVGTPEYAWKPRRDGHIRVMGYGDRAKILKDLGFKNYSDYLESQFWKRIRFLVLDRDGGSCRICARGAEVVHHRSYDIATMAGSSIDNLISLCRECHNWIEFEEGNKVSFERAEERFLELQEVWALLLGMALPPAVKNAQQASESYLGVSQVSYGQ